MVYKTLATAKAARAKGRDKVRSAKALTKRKLIAKPVKVPPENKLFPARPNYTGPSKGYFSMMHHEQLFELADGIGYRVTYVRTKKPPHERKVRLHNMMYLGGCTQIQALELLQMACCKVDPDVNSYELTRPISQAIEATARHIRKHVIAYIALHIPDHSWNEVSNKINGT